MEPFNKPYVDPDTKPGDAGTEPWADEPPGAEAGDGPTSETDEQGAIVGSPADIFDDGDAIEASDDQA